MQYFQLLELPTSLQLNEDTLKQAYQKKAGEHHPDQGGSEKTFAEVTQASETLKRLDLRVKHFLEVANCVPESKGAVSNVVMDYFMPIGELIQQVEVHQKALAEAQSALNKALLAPKTMELTEEVESLIDKVNETENSVFQDVAKHSDITSDNEPKVQTAFRDLSFLTKWKAQLREKYGELFTL